MRRSTFLDPLLRDRSQPFALVSASGARVAGRVTAAVDSASRRRGLLGRTGLDDEAMVIAPCGAVHTWFMRFPIDVVFVSRDGRVLRTRPAVRPWRMAWRLGAFATIELAAGTVAAAGLRPGDRVVVVEAQHAAPNAGAT